MALYGSGAGVRKEANFGENMLIVGKHHDYYDTAASFGIDKTVVYNRLNKTEKFDYKKVKHYPYPTQISSYRDIKGGLVGFCGNIYPYIEVTDKSINDSITHYFYDKDKLNQFLGLTSSKKNSWKKGWSWSWYNGSGGLTVRTFTDVERYFNPDSWRDYEKFFTERKIPVFAVKASSGHNLILEEAPVLKELDFMKVKDAHTAFQDIYMYISGVLGTGLPVTVKTEDKYIQAARGHDGEYSFKNPAGHKRGRKHD